MLKVFLVERQHATWCEDYAMVVVAEDKLHAEKKARLSSDDFRKSKDLSIEEIDLSEEQCVLRANVGA